MWAARLREQSRRVRQWRPTWWVGAVGVGLVVLGSWAVHMIMHVQFTAGPCQVVYQFRPYTQRFLAVSTFTFCVEAAATTPMHEMVMCVWPVGVDSMCTDWSWVWVASGRVLPVGSSVAVQRAMRVDIRRPALTWAGIVVATGCMFILTYMCRRLGSTAAVRRWTTRRRLMRRPRRTDITHEM